MPNWTDLTLGQMRIATKAQLLSSVSDYLSTHTKAEIIALLMDADEFADKPIVTHGEHGIISRTQTVRDALGDVVRVEKTSYSYYEGGSVDEIKTVVENAAGDTVEDRVIKHHIGPQPEGHFVLTVVLAPADVSGVTAPFPARYWKLVNVGSQAALWAVDAPAQVLLDLHAELWDMQPSGTFGVLAVASARGNWFLPKAVRCHTGMTVQEALARRDRIADYLDGLGKDTAELRAALDEQAQMEGIVAALGFSMKQLWSNLGR